MYHPLCLSMLLVGTDDSSGVPTKTVREITVNATRLAFFHESPLVPSIVQMEGGQRFEVKNALGAILIALRRTGVTTNWAKLTLAGNDRFTACVSPEKVNFVVPNPDGSSSIQIGGGGSILHVTESAEAVNKVLAQFG